MFQTKRIYDVVGPGDGYRILVDRLWPRGKKEGTATLVFAAKVKKFNNAEALIHYLLR